MVRGLAVTGLTILAVLLAVGAASAKPGAPTARPDIAPDTIKVFTIWGVYTREQRSQLVSEGYDIGERAWADHVELFGTDAEARALSLRGWWVVLKEESDDFPPPDSGYHNYAEMVADLQAVAAAYPQTVHPFSLGMSFENRDLVGVRISDDATDNLNEPGVFYVGQHHAREHLTVEVVLTLVHLYAESNKPEITRLVRNRQIYIVPSLNPDGAEYDIRDGNYHFIRKNRQPPDGTDQNRNYSYNWGCCGGSSSNQFSETYRGPSPFSTPEDSTMRDFMLAHPNIHTGISYHSNAALILYPYGYTFEDIPPDMTVLDHQTFVKMGEIMESTAGYTAQQSSDLYITDGDWNDWMYGALHKYPITVELSGSSFYPPDEFIAGEARRNWQAAVFVAKIADCPTAIVTGHDCVNP